MKEYSNGNLIPDDYSRCVTKCNLKCKRKEQIKIDNKRKGVLHLIYSHFKIKDGRCEYQIK